MMKSRIKTNKIMVWIFAGLLMLCAIFVVACACNEGTGSDSEPETPVLATVEIEYGDSMSVANGSTVENQTIAVISGGTLTAVKVGETKGVIDGEEKKIKVKPATVDVVLFTGQSNMVGRETTKYTVDIPSGKAYEYKYLNNTLVSVANPVGENIKGVVEVSSGSSIVPQFCADYIERTGRKIVAVHVARGGQQIKVFAPGGNINPVLIEKYNGCLEYLTESENFTVGRKFYVMFQGESDSLESSTRVVTSKAKYKETYMAFHNSVKTSCGTEFGALIQTGRNSYISYEGIVEIAQAKNELAFENDDIIMLDQKPVNYFTNNKNYMRSDNLHYNQNGLIQIAHDSCAALTDYLGYGQSDRAGVDPIEYLPMLNDVQSFALPESLEINILKGNKATINYTFTGTELFGSDVTVQPMDGRIEWSSDDEETATVANGVITALKTGTVTITAKPLAKSTMVKTMTVNIVEQKSPKTVYRWDFDSDISGTVTGPDDSTENLNANILDAAKTPSFSSGKYTADDANSVGWKLQNKSITLNKTSDWTIEWVGQSASLSTGGNASIILAGDNENFFITYQVDRGIYIRRGSADTQGLRFMEGNSYDRSVLYESHKWELRHTESDNIVALYMDGNLINSLPWGEIDLTVTTLLGRNGSASFKGEMDYIQITVYEEEDNSVSIKYHWDFDGDLSGTITVPDNTTENINANKLDASKTPSFSNGKYTADQANSVGWKLQDESITLNKTSDWTIEWVGQSASLSTGDNASIILAGDNENFFIAYQVDRGIFIKRGAKDSAGLRFMEGNSYDRSVLYESHKWELRHTESDNTVALYIDGNLINSLSWGEIDLTVTTLLGRNGSASFKGEMDYIQITIKQ